ncbi:MAG: hypothetical protein JXA42_15290 [Anaerolineales bacterium]|nr:hypothetical protein [Anaerolineales bacterium]
MKNQAPINLDYDLAVVEAMIAELENYLKSDVLYWQLSPASQISPPPPMLTIGGCLFRIHRLQNLPEMLMDDRKIRLQGVAAEYQEIVTNWAAHVVKKIQRETNARLNSWNWFVEDCNARKTSCIQYYPTEAELRTLIHLLLKEGDRFGEVEKEKETLAGMDTRFRRWFQPGVFVWRAELEPAYPKSEFWWLYGKPEFQQD